MISLLRQQFLSMCICMVSNNITLIDFLKAKIEKKVVCKLDKKYIISIKTMCEFLDNSFECFSMKCFYSTLT